MVSRLHAQFSRDLQSSIPNSTDPLTKIPNMIDGFGRSSILPRQTREHRLHLAETLSVEGKTKFLEVWRRRAADLDL